MRWLVVLVGALLGPRTWVALCVSTLAGILLLVAAVDPAHHAPGTQHLHHAGFIVLAWTWGVWLAFTIVARLRSSQ